MHESLIWVECCPTAALWLVNVKTFGLACVQDFADELDAMPSITMENNVIHNNEGYGIILVKPNNGEQQPVPLDTSEGR